MHPLDDAPVTPHSLAHLTYHPTAIPEILTSSRLLKRWQANDSPLNHNRSRCQDAAYRVPGKPLAGRLVEAAAISRYPQIPVGGHPCMLMIIRQTVEPKHCQTHRSRVVVRLVRRLLSLCRLYALSPWVSLSDPTLPRYQRRRVARFFHHHRMPSSPTRNMGIIANSPSSPPLKMIALQHRHRRRWST